MLKIYSLEFCYVMIKESIYLFMSINIDVVMLWVKAKYLYLS